MCQVICDWLIEEMQPSSTRHPRPPDETEADAAARRSRGQFREKALCCFGMGLLFSVRSVQRECCRTLTGHALYSLYLVSGIEVHKHYWQQALHSAVSSGGVEVSPVSPSQRPVCLSGANLRV